MTQIQFSPAQDVPKNLKGQTKVEFIVPDPGIFLSSPLLPLSCQRKINAVNITFPIICSAWA